MKCGAAAVVLMLALARKGVGQNSVPSPPPDVQHFGPLVVVSFNEDAPDPVTFRGDLLGGKRDDRVRALRAIGIDSSPELQKLWTAFLTDHSGENDDKVLMQFISGGMMEWNFGETGSKQAVLGAGFDELTDHPLELSAVFNLKDGRWRHVATIGCRCQMTDDAEPFNPHPGRPLPPQEWVVSLGERNEVAHTYHLQEIRFRLRDERLRQLIQFESLSEICPNGIQPGAACDLVRSFLEKSRLLNGQGDEVPGYVVISWDGTESLGSKGILPLRNPRCTAYTWDEIAFSYIPSQLKPKSCGPVPTPTKMPATTPEKARSGTGSSTHP